MPNLSNPITAESPLVWPYRSSARMKSPPFIGAGRGLDVAAVAAGAPVTSYSNAGGVGDRTASITVTSTWSALGTFDNLVDGAFANNTTDSINPTSIGLGTILKFDFGVGVSKYIDEARMYWQNTGALTLKWQVSPDDFAWYDASSNFSIDAPTKISFLAPPLASGYRYYRLVTMATGIPAGYLEEVEFKIAPGA